jgi:hypothetical protein
MTTTLLEPPSLQHAMLSDLQMASAQLTDRLLGHPFPAGRRCLLRPHVGRASAQLRKLYRIGVVWGQRKRPHAAEPWHCIA